MSAGRRGWTRRELLRAAALALPALPVLPSLALPPSPAAPLRVVVAGAGLAGLSAAYELVARGHQVTLLEARERAGGRVHTLRQPFSGGLYAEAGAISFSGSYRHLMRYLQAFGLPSGAPAFGPLATVCHLRGRRLLYRHEAGAAPPDWPFPLTAAERKLGLDGMFDKYFAAVDAMGDPSAAGWRLDRFAAYDRSTLAEHLERQGASAGAVEMLGDTLWFGYGWSRVSALHRLVSDLALYYLDQPAKVLPGGTDLLPRAFVTALGDRIRYRAAVTRIEQTASGVRVGYVQDGAERSLAADRLICALPCPPLRRVAFAPELPARRRDILGRLEYLPVTRIYLETRRRPWIAAGEAGSAFTDLPIHLVTEHPLTRSEPGSAETPGILECHVKGEAAQRLAAMNDEARIAFAAEAMEQVHPGFKAVLRGGTTVVWDAADPWAGGGYAWWLPGQLSEWMPELAAPMGRVHFAGEHTSPLARTMEGALESGNRAAREVHAAAGKGVL